MNNYKEAFAIISIIENMEAIDALSAICTAIDAISYKMNIPMLQAPCKGCLVIDDDSGLGTSIAPYIRRGYDTAVMFSRKSCKEKATFVFDYYDNYDKDVFLVFPWGE